MAPEHAPSQRLAHPIQFLDPYPIFETRQGRLGSQVVTVDRIPIQRELMNGITSQASRVVGVRIAACNREHALRQ